MTEPVTKEEVKEAARITMGYIAEAVDIATESLVSEYVDTSTALLLACAELCKLKEGVVDRQHVDIMHRLCIEEARSLDTKDIKKRFWEQAHKRNQDNVENMEEKRNE